MRAAAAFSAPISSASSADDRRCGAGTGCATTPDPLDAPSKRSRFSPIVVLLIAPLALSTMTVSASTAPDTRPSPSP